MTTPNQSGPAKSNLSPSVENANVQLRAELQAPSTKYTKWAGEYSDAAGNYTHRGSEGYTAEIVEPGAVVDLEASYLSNGDVAGLDLKRPVIVATSSPSQGQEEWVTDGQVMVKLPPRDPRTQGFTTHKFPDSNGSGVSIVDEAFVRANVQNHSIPTRLVVKGQFGRPGVSDRIVESATVSGEVLKAADLLNYEDGGVMVRMQEQRPPSPLASAETILNDARVLLGLPSGAHRPTYHGGTLGDMFS